MSGKEDTHLSRCMQTALESRKARGMKRELKNVDSSSVDLSSNDFLSLATSPTFRDKYFQNLACVSATRPLPSTGSRLLDGNSPYAEELEEFIVGFHNAPDGLLFNSGFNANVSVYSCVPQPGDVIVYDELIHASTHDGMRLSRSGKRVSFRHNSIESFKEVLCHTKDNDGLVRDGQRSVFVAVESVYSMDGDFAPIREILDMLDSVLPGGNGHLIVDEAHATGVFGPKGAGMVQMLGVQDRVFARIHTFGKSLASNGAIVLCSTLTKSYLLNYARPLIFTTALGLGTLVSIRTAYELLAHGDETTELQERLQALITFLEEGLSSLNSAENSLLKVKHHPASPIFALLTPFPRELASLCQEQSFIVRAIMPPTVPNGTQRVRVCLHAADSVEAVQRFIDTVGQWMKAKQQVSSRL